MRKVRTPASTPRAIDGSVRRRFHIFDYTRGQASTKPREGYALRVGIVGGGATGTCIVDALVRQPADIRQLDVTVFEACGEVGPGTAYQPDVSTALVNRQAGYMSIRHSQPGHLVDWLKGHPNPEVRALASPYAFIPRVLLGQYLKEVFEHAVHAGVARGVRTNVVRQAVMDVAMTPRGLAVKTNAQVTHLFDVVILAVGTSGPSDIFQLQDNAGFIADPYPMRAKLAEVAPAASVAVLGSGLTAVDVVIHLAHCGHRGPLYLMSRRGFLPGVRNPYVDPASRVITAEEVGNQIHTQGGLTLPDLATLIRRELAANRIPLAAIEQELDCVENPHQRLRRHLAEAQCGDVCKPLLVNASKEVIELVWEAFDSSTRRTFLRDWHALFMSLCNPMPIAIGERLATLIQSGQLRIVRGVRSVEAGHGASHFVIDTTGERFEVSTIVNAVRGETTSIPERAVDLVAGLTTRGLATPTPFGGLRIDVSTHQVLAASGNPVPGLFAFGQITVGDLYYTSSLPMITRRVEYIITRLLKQAPLAAEIGDGRLNLPCHPGGHVRAAVGVEGLSARWRASKT